MRQSLSLKTAQSLALTPQLKQSLHLLQISSLELQQEIQQELERNPLLELRSELGPEGSNEAAVEVTDTLEANASNPEPTAEMATDDDWQLKFESAHAPATPAQEFDLQQTTATQETLKDHLHWQLQMTSLSQRDLVIGNTLLHCLDNDGYLTASLAEVQKLVPAQHDVELDEIEAVLKLIKTLDPIGAGAADLSERLLILIAAQQAPDKTQEVAQQIVRGHLPLLATRNLRALTKTLYEQGNYAASEVRAAVSLITALNPRISSRFGQHLQNQVAADVIVKQHRGRWVTQLNPEQQNKLTINSQYENMLGSVADTDSTTFIQEHLNQAKSFIKNINNRFDTLLLVATAVVNRQQLFFEHGEGHLKPLNLADIAAAVGLHESTISRATANKYLLCSRGLFELKHFFSSAVTTKAGNASSSNAIRSIIKKLIDGESKAKPLSDNKLTQALADQGFVVARRTVAKYRESLGIAPSSKRKDLIS